MDLIIQMIAQEADECAWAPSGPIDSQHDETIYTIIYEYESSLQVNINCIRIRFCYSAIRAAFSLGLHMSQFTVGMHVYVGVHRAGSPMGATCSLGGRLCSVG